MLDHSAYRPRDRQQLAQPLSRRLLTSAIKRQCAQSRGQRAAMSGAAASRSGSTCNSRAGKWREHFGHRRNRRWRRSTCSATSDWYFSLFRHPALIAFPQVAVHSSARLDASSSASPHGDHNVQIVGDGQCILATWFAAATSGNCDRNCLRILDRDDPSA